MDNHEWLAERFEANRTHLRAVAYRMHGSLSEADDAVQERRRSPTATRQLASRARRQTGELGMICNPLKAK